jgi:hypothetical protein
MDETLKELATSKAYSGLSEIVKIVEVWVGRESYRIELYRNFSLPDGQILFGAHCFARMVIREDSGESQYAWISKELPWQDYPDAEGALRSTLRELARLAEARRM